MKKLVPATLEGCVVRISDIIAYLGKDRQDAERADLIADSHYTGNAIGVINAEIIVEHGKDYPLTIRTYGVSYQQINAWVRKYEEKGIDGLRDGRGRTKPADEMSAEERLRMENRILKAQLKDAEMENKLLKN